jgi:hypothetical protein
VEAQEAYTRATCPRCGGAPLTNATQAHAGTIFVRWPDIGKKYGWDSEALCGPTVMAAGNTPNCDGQCGKSHKAPLVGGKPFKLADHRETLVAEGLTKVQAKLQEEARARAKPPGQPKKIGNIMVYPARHFG